MSGWSTIVIVISNDNYARWNVVWDSFGEKVTEFRCKFDNLERTRTRLEMSVWIIILKAFMLAHSVAK